MKRLRFENRAKWNGKHEPPLMVAGHCLRRVPNKGNCELSADGFIRAAGRIVHGTELTANDGFCNLANWSEDEVPPVEESVSKEVQSEDKEDDVEEGEPMEVDSTKTPKSANETTHKQLFIDLLNLFAPPDRVMSRKSVTDSFEKWSDRCEALKIQCDNLAGDEWISSNISTQWTSSGLTVRLHIFV